MSCNCSQHPFGHRTLVRLGSGFRMSGDARLPAGSPYYIYIYIYI